MPVATLAGPPSAFTAGDTVRFLIGDSECPSDEWSAVFTVRYGATILSAAGTPDDGDDFLITLTAADTLQLPPGDYTSVARYTETATGDVISRQGRIIRVRPSLTTITVGPRRTAYEAARTALDALATRKNSSVNFNGQSFTSQSLSELQKMVDRMYMEAVEEDRQLGIGNVGGVKRIVTRM